MSSPVVTKEGQMKNDTTNFDRIMSGLNEVAEIVEGKAAPARAYVPDEIDVKAIRKKIGMTQDAFAARFGFSVASVRDWEQKRCRPEGAARAFLVVIDKAPEAVQHALTAA